MLPVPSIQVLQGSIQCETTLRSLFPIILDNFKGSCIWEAGSMNAFVCLCLCCVQRKKTKLNHGGECEKLSFYFVFVSLIISQRYILPSVSLSFILCVCWDEVHIRKFFWARNILEKSDLCRQCWLLSVTLYGRQQNTQFICFLFKKNVKLYFCFFADWILIIVFNANTWTPPNCSSIVSIEHFLSTSVLYAS